MAHRRPARVVSQRMTLDEIKRLIEFVRSQDLTEFELEQDGVKLRLKSSHHAPAPVHLMQAGPTTAAPPPPAPGVAAPSGRGVPDQHAALPVADGGPESPDATDDVDLAIVKSPIVGTFYRASEPGAASFVEIGDTVKKGGVLCIIEAMKLMNEIDSEYDGEVVNIYVENGQAVQYGERLFAIRLKSS
jgi:acetyl-CoA carboxylase biotin carboxyl carrier protein